MKKGMVILREAIKRETGMFISHTLYLYTSYKINWQPAAESAVSLR